MPRVITETVREAVALRHAENPDHLGLHLGSVVLKANIPIQAVAQLLTASEATAYRWIYGDSEPRAVYHPNIRRLITILNKALRAGDAPLSGTHAERMAAIPELVTKHKALPKRSEFVGVE